MANDNSEIQAITNFLKTKFSKCIPIPLCRDTKRPFDKFEFAAHKVTVDDMWKKWEDVGIHLVSDGTADMAISLRDDIIVIDADNEELANDWAKMEGFKDTVAVKTKKGIHFYFLRTPEIDDWITEVKPCEVEVDKDGVTSKVSYDFDIITFLSTGTGSLITCPPSANKQWIRHFSSHDILPIPEEFVAATNATRKHKHYKHKIITHDGQEKEVEVDDVQENRNRIDADKLKKVVGALSNVRADEYQDWIRVCWAIFNIAALNGYKRKGKNLVHKFSQRSSKYNESDVDRFYESISYRKLGLGLGFLLSCLKQDNVAEFKKIVKSLNTEQAQHLQVEGYRLVDDREDRLEILLLDIYNNINHDNCAELFCFLNQKYIFVGDDTFYERNTFGAYNLIDPAYQKEKIDTDIKTTICPIIKDYYPVMRRLYRDNTTNEDELKKKLNALAKRYDLILSKLGSCGFITGVRDTIKQKLLDISAAQHMDENPNLIMFKNGVLDLTTLELRSAKQGEYLSLYMGTDLPKQPKDIVPADFAEAEDIVNEWFDPDGLDATYFKKLGGSFLEGGNKQQVGHFFNGKGSNAKSKAQEIYEKSFNDYFKPVPPSLYTKKEEDGQKPQPFRLHLKGRRITWANETDEKVKFETINFHNECDNSIFETRNMYSKTIVRVRPQYKNVVATNYLPAFTSDAKLATIRRIRVLLFKYCFLPEDTINKDDPLHKPVNLNLSDDIDRLLPQFNMMWVYYYMRYKEEGLHPTPYMIEKTREYIKALDSVKLFMTDAVEKSNTGEKAWINKLFKSFEYWCEHEGLEKPDKRKFISKLRDDFEVRKEKGRSHRRDELYIKDYKIIEMEDDEYDEIDG